MYDYWMWAPPFHKSTIQSAVVDGGGNKDVNRPGIYNGGGVAKFCLDTVSPNPVPDGCSATRK